MFALPIALLSNALTVNEIFLLYVLFGQLYPFIQAIGQEVGLRAAILSLAR